MHNQQLQRLRQKLRLFKFYSGPFHQKRNRGSRKTGQSQILQPLFSGPKTRRSLETSHKPQFCQPILNDDQIQNGSTRVNQIFTEEGRMDYLNRPDKRLSQPPYTTTIQEIPQVPYPGGFIPIHQSSLWPSNSHLDLHLTGKESQTNGPKTGHMTTPVPG